MRIAVQTVSSVVAGLGVLLLAGCASVGPPTVTRDRFDYVTTISDSWKRQTLLNLLKVRYAGAPVFMDVSSVISSYSLEGDVPATDIAEGRASDPRSSEEQQRLFPPLIAVKQGSLPPDDAFVSVPYRGGWFSIDDRDQRSKRMPNFLMLMFSLTEGGPSQGAPIVTVPAR